MVEERLTPRCTGGEETILTSVPSSLFRRKNYVFIKHNGRGDGPWVRRSEEPVFCREQYSCHSPSVIDTVGIVAVVCIFKVLLVLLKHLYVSSDHPSYFDAPDGSLHFKWVELLVEPLRGSVKADCGILWDVDIFLYLHTRSGIFHMLRIAKYKCCCVLCNLCSLSHSSNWGCCDMDKLLCSLLPDVMRPADRFLTCSECHDMSGMPKSIGMHTIIVKNHALMVFSVLCRSSLECQN